MPKESKELIDLAGKLDFHLRNNSDEKRMKEIIKKMRNLLTVINTWEFIR